MIPRSSCVFANGIWHHYLEWDLEWDLERDPEWDLERPRPSDLALSSRQVPTVLMMHATGLCAHSWLPIAKGLATQYRVIALDQRGHGDTGPTDDGYSFELVGQDLAAVIEALDLNNLCVVGHSSGGLATLIAASLLPGRINRACLVETRVGESPANAPAGELQERARRTRMKRSMWESRDAMHIAYRQRAAFKDWSEEAFSAFISGGTTLLPDGRAELKCSPDVEALFYEQRDALQVSQYFEGLVGRFLLLLGAYPEAQTLRDVGVRRFLEKVPGARAKPMGMGSHFLPMEHPEQVLDEIREFFSREENVAD